MSVSPQQTIFNYIGNGVATVYAFSCRVLDSGDLKVTVDGIAKANGVDYSLIGVGADNGGSVVFVTPPANLAAVRIFRSTQLERETDYQTAGDFRAKTVNDDFDRPYMLVQDLVAGAVEIGNTLRVPAGDGLLALPAALSRAGFYLGFDGSGQPTLMLPAAGTAGALAATLAATSGSSTVGFTRSETGAQARTLLDKLRDTVSAFDFMTSAQIADVRAGTGLISVTAALQAAINTGKTVMCPNGTYLLTDVLTMSTAGQVLRGEGKYTTVFKVTSASFNMSAAAVINMTSGEPGAVVRDLTILFTQPDSATRASYNQYPPAIKATAVPRFVVQDARILQAWNGISMTGNSGGAQIDGLDLFSYNVGIDISGALDSVRITRLHWYNFAATANQITVFYMSPNVGIQAARADDIHISDGLFIGALGIRFYDAGSGGPFGNVTNCDFDTSSGVKMEAGKIQFAACLFTLASAGNIAFDQSGGRVLLGTCEFESPATLTYGFIRQTGTALTTFLGLSNCRFDTVADNKAIDSVSTLQMVGCQFNPPPNLTMTNPLVNVGSGGRITAVGNRVTDKGTGTGNWLAIAADDHHVVLGNATVGWGQSIPTPYSAAVVGLNGGGPEVWTSFATTLGSGAGTITSGSATMRYRQVGKTMHVQWAIAITTNGTGATNLTLSLPKAAAYSSVGSGRETAVNGKGVTCTVVTSSL